ncbi:MAG TPA: sugar ABC transporter substrate-binding protein [Firmicutes bacterium]|jgi:ribose transport system substrate-binding protein|nr:sugar ABC transporter substrate-binding protein [Bacillota bacterium]
MKRVAQKIFMVGLLLCLAVTVNGATNKEGGKKYRIVLCNSYMGNDWRQEMEKVVAVVATKSPYKERVELRIVNTENTPEAQSASIDALAQQGCDAILVDGASPTALNPSIERAIKAGIVVVSFDQVVTAPGAWKVETDFQKMPLAWANFVAKSIKGKGNIIFDRGMPGASISLAINKVAKDVFKKYPGIKIVGEFDGKYADGPVEQGVSSVLAANPKIDAVFSQGYAEPIIRAFKAQNRPVVPMCVWNTNGGMVALAEGNYKGLVGNNLPGLGAIALKTAVGILDGKKPAKHILINPQFSTTDESIDLGVGYKAEKIEIGKNCFKDLPPALDWPVLPNDFGVTLTPQEIVNQ